MKRGLALILCVAMLFCGCREGGYEDSGGRSFSTSEIVEEFNFGVRTEYSSSTVSSSSSSSVSGSTSTASGSVSTVPIIQSPPESTSEYPEAPVQSSTEQTDLPATGGEITDDREDSGGNKMPSVDEDVPAYPDSDTESEPDEPVQDEVRSPYDYEGTVYVASSGKGTKYHKSSTCSNMKGANGMTVDEALAKGYTPCKKCW